MKINPKEEEEEDLAGGVKARKIGENREDREERKEKENEKQKERGGTKNMG